jgi:hypothetical protein
MTATSQYLNAELRSLPLAALERLRATLELAYGLAGPAGADDIKGTLADLMADCATLIREELEAEQPCSDEARSRGCSCRMPQNEYDPEPLVDRHCCLHGDPAAPDRVGLFDDGPDERRAAE